MSLPSKSPNLRTSDQEESCSSGFPTKSFYTAKKSRKDIERESTLKRRLEAACTSVKKKRVEDYLLSDGLQESHILSHPPSHHIYRVFAKQRDALDFAEKLELNVFALELNATGKRNFLACQPQTFWRLLKAKSPENRHAYEVIGENQPAKLYFDLEFKKTEHKVDGNKMLADFKRFIRANLCQASFSNLIGNIEVIDLDSSTEEKFSHHLIVNLYCDSSPVFFANNLEVGKFVHALIEKMKANDTLVLSPSLVFVDDAVYTKNRNFRTFLSSKFGKRATLRRSEQYSDDEDASTLHHLSEQEFFFKSLVTFSKDFESNGKKMERRRLIQFDVASLSYKRLQLKRDDDQRKARSTVLNTTPSGSVSSSPFPEIDAHIRNLVSPGYIRKIVPSPCGWYLTYEFANYRKCLNIGREHKSNNVILVVDLKTNKICQLCHDSQCKDYRSEFWKLPTSCAIPWEEFFDEGNSSVDNNGDRGPLWNSFSNENPPEEEEIDALLLEAAEEAATDQLLLQIAQQEDEEDSFLMQVAQHVP